MFFSMIFNLIELQNAAIQNLFFGAKKRFWVPPSAILSLKNHAFQLRTCFFAIFAARVLAGRAVVEKRLKRCLKRYSSGAVAFKTPCETYLVRKRQKTAHLDSFVSPAGGRLRVWYGSAHVRSRQKSSEFRPECSSKHLPGKCQLRMEA